VIDAGPQTPRIEQAALMSSGNILTYLIPETGTPAPSAIPYISSLNL